MMMMIWLQKSLVLGFQVRNFIVSRNIGEYTIPSNTGTHFPNNRRGSELLLSLQSPPNIPLTINHALDVAGVFGGVFFLLSYHLKLHYKEKQGKRTWRSSQADTREQWSQYVRQNEQWLYAIQTLRNAITAQTFLSTTVLSLLTVIGGRLWDIIRNLGEGGDNRRYLIAQFVMVAACMLTSAYQFLQSARFMTHAGFMFPVQPKKTKVDNIMRKSQNAQWLGLRFLYISVGMIAWVVGGPKVFFFSSLLLSLFFRKIDRVPEGIDDDYTFDI